MDVEQLQRRLATHRFGRQLVHCARTGSTNALAVAAVAAGNAADGAVFVADRQSGGRGTGGRRWLSDDPAGLWHSIVLAGPIQRQPLSFVPAIALVDTLRDAGVDAHLKWPNDVLAAGGKIAGILVESQRRPDGEHDWIVGVGVNLDQTEFPAEIAGIATSMRICTGRRHDRDDVMVAFLHHTERIYDGDADLISAWRTRSRMLGRRIRATRRGTDVTVTAVDLNDAGHLIVEHTDGRRDAWVSASDLSIDADY